MRRITCLPETFQFNSIPNKHYIETRHIYIHVMIHIILFLFSYKHVSFISLYQYFIYHSFHVFHIYLFSSSSSPFHILNVYSILVSTISQFTNKCSHQTVHMCHSHLLIYNSSYRAPN